MVDDAVAFFCFVRVATCQGMFSKLSIILLLSIQLVYNKSQSFS